LLPLGLRPRPLKGPGLVNQHQVAAGGLQGVKSLRVGPVGHHEAAARIEFPIGLVDCLDSRIWALTAVTLKKLRPVGSMPRTRKRMTYGCFWCVQPKCRTSALMTRLGFPEGINPIPRVGREDEILASPGSSSAR
jgi:hypothetical protein